MRIIAGRWKGTRLISPGGMKTRPTTDRVKESVFSILGRSVENARVLDLCAGTGNLGFEALSRGAESAVFVEKSAKALAIIRENSEKLRAENVRVLRGDAQRFVRNWDGKESFSLIFFDPPYRGGLYRPVLEAIDHSQILCAEGLVVVEHGRDQGLAASYQSLAVIDSRRYGDTQISFLKRQKEVDL